MIVGIVPIGAGIVPVNNQFFEAASVAAGVLAYANGYTPPRNPADFIGFDTGWSSFTAPSPGKRWAYDRTGAAFIEIDVVIPARYETICIRLSGTVNQALPRASTATSLIIFSYTNPTDNLTVSREVGTDTINGVAADKVNLPQGLYIAIPSSISNWQLLPQQNDAISVYDQVGGQSFTGTITVAFDTLQKNTNPAKFTTPAAGIAQVNAAGTFKISYDISGDVAGNIRTTMKTWLEVNAVEVPGTSAYSYHRNAANGEDTASMTTVIDLVAGDQLRVRAQRFAGTGTTLTVLGGSRLTIEQIR